MQFEKQMREQLASTSGTSAVQDKGGLGGMPTMPGAFSGVRYTRPYGYSLFVKESKVADTFGIDDYYTDDLKRFDVDDFSVKKIFD